MNILSNIAVFLMYTDVHIKETLCSNVSVKKWFLCSSSHTMRYCFVVFSAIPRAKRKDLR